MSNARKTSGRIHWGNGIRNDVPVSNRIGRLIYETSLVQQKKCRLGRYPATMLVLRGCFVRDAAMLIIMHHVMPWKNGGGV